MRVFKNYFKITWAHKTPILLYTIIFFVLMSFATKNTTQTSYKPVDVNIYVQDKANTKLSKSLYDYLNKNAKIKTMDENIVDDKLFYEIINAAVIIPEDFDKTREVLYKVAPNNAYALDIKEKINIYLSQVSSYEKSGFTEAEAIKNANEDLDKKIDVSIKEGSVNPKKDKSKFYFNFLNYLLLAQVILVVSNIALVYKKQPILMRNNVSPCPRTRINMELMLGHIVTGLVFWLIYMILFCVLYKYDFTKTHVNLMMFNSFVFTISVVSMAVMISNVIKNSNTVQGVMNIVSLGSSFLCGAFVPQELLGKTALTIGRIFPGFYYIRNNEILVENPEISKILPNILIMLGFSVVFIVISVLAKPKGNDNINK